MVKWGIGVLVLFTAILFMIFLIPILGSSYWPAAIILMFGAGYLTSEHIMPFFFGKDWYKDE